MNKKYPKTFFIPSEYFLTKNLKVTTVRLFNTVGPRQTGKYGMVIPRFINAALENKPIKIFSYGLRM